MIEKEENAVVLHQTLAMLPIFLLEIMVGIGIGWIAPMLHYLKNSSTAAFNSENCAWIAALHYAGRGLTSFVSVFMIDRLGRNVFFVIASFICFFMWLIVYASQNVYVHYVVRLLFGLSVGLQDTAAGIYIGENCSAKLRGVFSGFIIAGMYLGEVVEFLLAAFFSYEWVAIINCTLGFVTVLSLYLLREPAHYLIMKGDVVKAKKNYDWLHDLRNAKAEREFQDIKQYILEERSAGAFSWRTLRSKEVSKSIRIVVLMSFFCLFGGYSAVNSFVTMALSGSTGFSNTELTILFGAVLFITISMSSPFMDKFNRRTLFLWTTAFIVIVHAVTAVLLYANTVYLVPHFYWILFTLLTAFMSVHGMFILPITMVVRGELLPQNVKAAGTSLTGIFSSVGAFLGAKMFLPISDAFGVYTNFVIFSFANLFMFVYVYFDLPETKGKTLTDIQRELKNPTVS